MTRQFSFVLCACALFTNLAFANQFDVAFYNVQNLFDADKDKGKDDWTFLPSSFPGKSAACQLISNSGYRKQCLRTDWTAKKVALRVDKMAKAIKTINPKLPQMLGLAEVENKAVVGLLAKALGYKHWIVSEGPDRRGIDVALLFNTRLDIEFLGDDTHPVDDVFFSKKPTRDILSVDFLIAKKHLLTVFVNHWPSQAASGKARTIAAHKMMEAMQAKEQFSGEKHFFLAMGDFNTISADKPHPFKTVLYKGSERLYNIYDEFFKDINIDAQLKNSMPRGTYFYKRKKQWNVLDCFFVNAALLSKIGNGPRVILESFRIQGHQLISKKYRNFLVPYGFNSQATQEKDWGYSDHYPIKMTLKWN